MKLKFLTVLSLCFICFLTVGASAKNKCGDNAYWEINNTTLTISGSGALPDYSKSTPAPWADNATKIKTLIIGEGITSIGSWNFYNFTELSDVTLPSTLTKIGERAFYDCSAIEYISIPDSVTTISSGAFNSCISLKRVELPKALEYIGASAFMNLPKLTAITIPKNTNTILDYAFMGNSNLSAMYFEGSVPENTGKLITEGANDDFVVFCPRELTTEWSNSKIFPIDILYIYDPSQHIRVYVNNSEVVFDQFPIISKSRTLVPIRAIFEAMGAVVNWDGTTKTVSAERNGVSITIQTGANVMHKGNEQIPVDVPAQIINDRVLVPVRVIGEAFGADVQWNGEKRHVDIFIK